jgi:hypothetical protein
MVKEVLYDRSILYAGFFGFLPFCLFYQSTPYSTYWPPTLHWNVYPRLFSFVRG